MNIISNIFIESVNQKILVKYGENGLELPYIIPNDSHTLKDHITTMLLGIGITDVVEDDIELYNIDDFIDNGEHTIVISFKVHTKYTSISNKFNYKFMQIGDLKENLDKLYKDYDRFISRLYILNPYN